MSVADAERLARERAAEIVRKAANREPLDQYWYGERPLREPIIDEITNREGERIGLVTRNAYGALVLNTATAMFINVDFERPSGIRSLLRTLRGLLGTRAPAEELQHLQRLESWAKDRPELSVRVYRTLGGLRYLVTDRLFEPAREETLEFLQGGVVDLIDFPTWPPSPFGLPPTPHEPWVAPNFPPSLEACRPPCAHRPPSQKPFLHPRPR